MKRLLVLSVIGAFALLNTGISLAAGCRPQGPDADGYITMIRWSSYCFVGGDAAYVAVLHRIDRYDGTTTYQNQFRGRFGVPLVGTFANEDPEVFKGALGIVNSTQAETIRLRQGYYLDGCASYLSTTRCGRTLIISELDMDADPEFKRLDGILRQLTDAVLKFHWIKISDNKMVLPLMLDSIELPGPPR